MIRVKICGINDEPSFDAAVEAGSDWLGFVFFPGSPRYIAPSLAAKLSSRVDGGPLRVGLFVEPTASIIESTLQIVNLDILQIYSPLTAIRPRQDIQIWRAFGVATADDLPFVAADADRLLIEAKPPAGADRPGGNAVNFDWSIMKGWRAPAPWILAGGLTPQNVATAIELTGASAVDVSSGVESSRGVKDPALIRAFVNAAKNGTKA